MGPHNPKARRAPKQGQLSCAPARSLLFLTIAALTLWFSATTLLAQQPSSPAPAPQSPSSPAAQPVLQSQPPLPDSPGTARIAGTVTDTDGASIPNALVTLEQPSTRTSLLTTRSDADGAFTLSPVAPGTYRVRIHAPGFSEWKVEDVVVHPSETVTLTPIELGVESINSVVDAITIEDLAEQQITAEEHQRILGVLPNFYVSYVSHAAPLTRKQKFKLALVVSRDPLTFFTTGVTAGIEQAEGDFSGYGPGWAGYAQRYAATYGDRIDSTFLGAALLPSLLHQDPRFFYLDHGSVLHRALYAISTTVICKGDNGHWQPNYSNVFGNLGAAGISTLYYPKSDQHSVQVTVDNTLLGVAEGAFGTLFQEFLLRHLTHGTPPKTPPLP